VSPATVSRVLRRYEREHGVNASNIDIKTLGRFNAIGIASPAIAQAKAIIAVPDGSSPMFASNRAFAEPNEKHANAVTNLLLHHGGQRIGWIKRAGSQAPLSD
jgi:hypothetical protein